MSFEEALEIASRDERFKAALYAMNTLLIQKQVYSREEFQALFVEWVEKQQQQPVADLRDRQTSDIRAI